LKIKRGEKRKGGEGGRVGETEGGEGGRSGKVIYNCFWPYSQYTQGRQGEFIDFKT